MKRNKTRTGMLLILALLLAAGCAPAQPASEQTPAPAQASGSSTQAAPPSGEPIAVGVVAPLSGTAAMLGDLTQKGIQLAADQINAAGGINGRPIKLIFEDDEQVPAKAVSAVNKLIHNDKVAAVIGSVNTGCTLASMEVSQAAQVPQITLTSSGLAVTNSGNPWIIRMQASDEYQAGAIAGYAVHELKLSKLAVMYGTDDYGTGGKDFILAYLKEAGIDPVAIEGFDINSSDLSPQLLSIKQAGAEGILLWTSYKQGALVAKQAQQLGMEGVYIMGGGGLNNKALFDLAGEAAAGLMNTHTFFADESGLNQTGLQFVQDYEAAYGATPTSDAATAYDSMILLARAFEQCPDLDGQGLMDALKATKDLEMASGVISINEKGDSLRDHIYVVRFTQTGDFELCGVY